MNVLHQSFTHISYHLSLTDENNELIPLNGFNVNITLLFYKQNDVYDKIKDFIKLLILKSEQKK